MNITIETRSYSAWRYGEPYIAVIDFTDPKGTPTWGNWIGQPGDAGMLSIDAHPGDIIMHGQKDGCGNNPPNYYVVQADGTLDLCATKATKAEAYKAYKAWKAWKAWKAKNPLADFSLEELQAEIARRGA